MPNAAEIAFANKSLEDLSIPHNIDVNPLTGTAQISVGIPVTPSRSEFQPNLTLEYSSSSHNSIYGNGWGLSGVPSISLSHKDGLPKYDGSDKYTFNGSQLVPWFEKIERKNRQRPISNDDYIIKVFRSRVEKEFIRFERWQHRESMSVHWKMRDRNNTVFVFGLSEDGSSRVSNPKNQQLTHQWLLESQYDLHGNAINYHYEKENTDGVNKTDIYEHDRHHDNTELPQRYLKRIQYGNTKPLNINNPIDDANKWLFELILDYGEHSSGLFPVYDGSAVPWSARMDSFSNYQAGFEVRTYRLCRGFLLFHHFDELGDGPTLVGAFTLEHEPDQIASTIKSIHYDGYRRDTNGSYTKKTLPPLRFTYTQPVLGQQFRPAPKLTHENTPYGIGSTNHSWVDLYSEGLPGILYESNQAWMFKSNLGDGHFGPQQLIAQKPSAKLGEYAVSDFDGNGNLNLVVLTGREAGYYEFDRDQQAWQPYQAFSSTPMVSTANANTQLLDMNGDGRADIVCLKNDSIAWYPSKGKEGFDSAMEHVLPRTNGVTQAPTIGTNLNLDYFFADMSGDGLPDQVRVINGRVEYWSQLGHGKFSQGVVMANSPDLELNGEFDASRVRLIDLTGTGTSDLIYIGRGEIKYWINANGNSFVNAGIITGLPYIDNISSANILDFLGDGTACLVWSSTSPGQSQSPIHYLQLTDGIKSGLINSVENSMGREIKLSYSTSGKHFLNDKKSEDPWLSKLPRHTTVVDRLEITDHIAKTKAHSRYEYHDGFFDSEEREFRGFGLVDQYDALEYLGDSLEESAGYAQPTCIRTWFHNGLSNWDEKRREQFYKEDELALNLQAVIFENDEDIKPKDRHHAYNAIAGQVFRSEVYGADSSGKRDAHPYEVTQTGYLVKYIQSHFNDYDACFFSQVRENLTSVYEKNSLDPRINHELVLDYDDYGNPTLSCTVGYPRRSEIETSIPAQTKTLITVADSSFHNIDENDRYFLGIPIEIKEYELKNLNPPTDSIFDYSSHKTTLQELLVHALEFNQQFGTVEKARRVQWNRFYYWNTDRTLVLPLKEIGQKPLLHHQETACLTPEIITEVFAHRINLDTIIEQGYYVFKNGYIWQLSPTMVYLSAELFSLQSEELFLDGGQIRYGYDEPYYLNLVESTDSYGNQTRAKIDYHQIAPNQITDLNNNVAEVIYDPLGVVMVSTQYGQIESSTGAIQDYGHQPLRDYELPASLADIILNPSRYLQGASQFVHYDLDSWQNDGKPLRQLSLTRSEFVNDGEGGGVANTQLYENQIEINIEYLDGFGRNLQSKTKVDAGSEDWRSTSQPVYNNKQQIVRQYQPFLSNELEFEPETHGKPIEYFYDSLDRLVKTQFPDGTQTKSVYSAWKTEQFDQVDAVEGTEYESRIQTEFTDPSHPQRKALANANTPVIVEIDPLGRELLTIEKSRDGPSRNTLINLDIAGQPISVIDPRELTAFRYQYDMQGRLLYESGLDAGEKRIFTNALDQTIHYWDGREIKQSFDYDLLGRVETMQINGVIGTDNLDRISERIEYGESLDPDIAQQRNLRGQIIKHFDQAGTLSIDKYDLLGNPLSSTRQVTTDYKQEPNWNTPSVADLDDAQYTTRTQYDALGRVKQQQLPDQTTRKYNYSRGNGINTVSLTTEDGSHSDQLMLKQVRYNEFGQRSHVELGNDVELNYSYDTDTQRLTQSTASRVAQGNAPSKRYQQIQYLYDPVGNITYTNDLSQQDASNSIRNIPDDMTENHYTYDAFYQLIEATGRAHQSLLQNDYDPTVAGTIKGIPRINLNDVTAVRTYTREYSYDLSGNLTNINHLGFRNREIWTSASSNRSLPLKDLNGIEIRNPEQHFDANGNCNYLPHLNKIIWNYRNNIAQAIIIDRSTDGRQNDAEYYLYGSDGMRVRKVSEKLLANNNVEIIEKLYLDGCEIKRIKINDRPELERITTHISDGDQTIARIHRWTLDYNGQETDNIAVKKTHYLLSNHLGSTSLEVNEHGEVISYEEYFPFGGTAFIAGNEREVKLKDYRYSGKECDDATGLYYFGYRYYAVWIGNWLSPDPIGPEDGLNLYQFVGNNPVNFVDEFGLQSSSEARFREFHRNHNGNYSPTPEVNNGEGGTIFDVYGERIVPNGVGGFNLRTTTIRFERYDGQLVDHSEVFNEFPVRQVIHFREGGLEAGPSVTWEIDTPLTEFAESSDNGDTNRQPASRSLTQGNQNTDEEGVSEKELRELGREINEYFSDQNNFSEPLPEVDLISLAREDRMSFDSSQLQVSQVIDSQYPMTEQANTCEGLVDCDARVDEVSDLEHRRRNTTPFYGRSDWTHILPPEFTEHSVESYQGLLDAEWAISREWRTDMGGDGGYLMSAWYRREEEEWREYNPCDFDRCGSARSDLVGNVIIGSVASMGLSLVWSIGSRAFKSILGMLLDKTGERLFGTIADDVIRGSFRNPVSVPSVSNSPFRLESLPARLLEPRVATQSTYRWTNYLARKGNLIHAQLTNGVLEAEVRATVPNAIRRSGSQLFDDAFAHFGAQNIRAFRALWVSRGSLTTNYRQFINNLRSMNPKEAAWNTWTGLQMRRLGFRDVRFEVGIDAGEKYIVAVFLR